MNYNGSMEGWNEDENECQGYCGCCESCIETYEIKCDLEYDNFINENNKIGINKNEIYK